MTVMSATLNASKLKDLNTFDPVLMDRCNISVVSPSLELSSPRVGGILGVLGDSEGVKLFNTFLSMRSSGHLLDFWFACKGFRTNLDINNPDKSFQVAKIIYRTYVKSGADHAVPLPPSLKHEIVERMSWYHKGYKSTCNPQAKQGVMGIDRTLFDAAQENVGSLLEQKFYPEFLEFLKSNSIYVSAARNHVLGVNVDKTVGDVSFKHAIPMGSPKARSKSKRKSSRQFSQESVDDFPLGSHPTGLFSPPITRPGGTKSGKLPTRMTTSWTTTSVQSPLPCSSHAPGLPGSQEPVPTCDMDCSQCACPEWDRFYDPPFSSPAFTPLFAGENPVDRDRSRHPAFAGPVLEPKKTVLEPVRPDPTGSDPTDPNTVGSRPVAPGACSHDSDADYRLPSYPSLQPTYPSVVAETEVGCTNATGYGKKDALERPRADLEPTKPRQNLAETDPAAFVLLLTNRLEKVKESRGKMEKLLSWVNQVDEKNTVDTNFPVSGNDLIDDLSYEPSAEPHSLDHRNECDPSVMSSRYNAAQCKSPPAHLPNSCLTKFATCEWNARPLDPLLLLPAEDEDAQGILDEHCSRIWADEQDSTLAPEAHKDFTKQPGDLDYSLQDVHGLCTDPTLRRSRGAYCDSPEGRVTGRRRNAVSAALMPDSSDLVQKGSRRRSSIRAYHRSDARSTASWDSGVVTHCPYPPESPYPNSTLIQGELETRSIVAAASLQALSSSTTELAMVNSEVTTKLVEHMTRHYRRNADSAPFVHPAGIHPFAPKMSPYQNYDLLCSPPPVCRSVHHHHHPYLHQPLDPVIGKPAFGGTPAMQGLDNVGHSPSCIQNTWRPCTFHQLQPQQLGPGWSIAQTEKPSNQVTNCGGGRGSTSSQSFPAASDTSSTFDSGISSTYDQLPLVSSQSNTDRGSRSQSLRNWHANFRESSSGPNANPRQLRAPSVPRSRYNSTMHACLPGVCAHPYTLSNLTSANCAQLQHYYLSTDDTATVATQRQGLKSLTCPNPCSLSDCCNCKRNLAYDSSHNPDLSRKDAPQMSTDHPSGRPAGSGQLLQHWLYLQTSQSICSDEGPSSSSQTKTVHSRKQQQHHHHNQHHHRRSSTHHRHTSRHVGGSPAGWDENTSILKDQSIRPNELSLCSRTTCPLDSIEPVPGTHNGLGLIVGYYLCDDPVPYRTVWTGTQTASDAENQSGSTSVTNGSLTLGQFKQLIAKKGSYRYFFKKPSDEFGTGVVHEELTHDDAVIPLWDGKVVARIERAE